MALVPSTPERVEMVNRIFRWYAKENLGRFAIVNRLNEALHNGTGCVSATGRPWSIGAVQGILQNEHYIGNTVFNKRSMGKFFRLVAENGNISPERLPKHLPTVIRRNPKKDWIVIENTHEPLIPRDLFEAAQTKRQARQTNRAGWGRSLGSKYLFSGKLVCGQCGFHFQGITKKKRDWTREGYVCGGYKLRGKHTCKNWFLPAEIIEPAVFDALQQEVQTLKLSGAIGRGGEDLGNAPMVAEHRREQLTQQICQVEERLENLLACITPENKNLISQKMVSLQEERDRLKGDLEDVASIEAQAVASTKLVGRLVQLAAELRDLWDVATLAEKKEFLSFLVESVSIQPERKTARICLSHKYLEIKKVTMVKNEKSFLSGRGDPNKFERILQRTEILIKYPCWMPRCA